MIKVYVHVRQFGAKAWKFAPTQSPSEPTSYGPLEFPSFEAAAAAGAAWWQDDPHVLPSGIRPEIETLNWTERDKSAKPRRGQDA